MTVEARPSCSRPNHHSPLWYFERFGLLHGLSEQQKQDVERHTRMVNVRRGQPVYLPGDPSEHVYVIKSGAVKIVGKSPEGCDVILALLTPGDIFGELALMGETGPGTIGSRLWTTPADATAGEHLLRDRSPALGPLCQRE